MSAQILNTIEKLETQQQNILNSAAKENKQVLEALQKGMKDNSDVIQSNIQHLKEKIGIDTAKKEAAKEWNLSELNFLLRIFNLLNI